MTTKAVGLSAQEKKTLQRITLRSNLLNGSMQAIKRQAMGFTYALIPALAELYDGDKEKMAEALQRHDTFINTHASFGAFLLGLVYALEKQKAEGKGVTSDMITNIKASLMGPLAGIGDSIFHITLRVIGAGIGINFALEGNILGAFIFMIIYGGTFLAIKYPLCKAGYTLGTQYLKDLFEKGLIKSLTKSASILGLMMVGGLVSSLMNVNTTLAITFGETSVGLQTMFDQIVPELLAIITVFGVYKLIKRKVSITKIAMGMIVLGIALSFFGIM